MLTGAPSFILFFGVRILRSFGLGASPPVLRWAAPASGAEATNAASNQEMHFMGSLLCGSTSLRQTGDGCRDVYHRPGIEHKPYLGAVHVVFVAAMRGPSVCEPGRPGRASN